MLTIRQTWPNDTSLTCSVLGEKLLSSSPSAFCFFSLLTEFIESGFNRDDEWGYRACEPQRNVISSMALVLLKTGINHHEDNNDGSPEIDPVQMGTAQKLLLFWRKPAVGMIFRLSGITADQKDLV